MQSALFIAGVAVSLAVFVFLLIFIGKAGRNFRQAAYWLVLLSNAAILAFSIVTFISNRTFTLTIYQFTTALTFSFAVDRLASFFIGTISLVSISVSLYSLRYSEHHGMQIEKNLGAAVTAIFILSMEMVVASANTFSLLFWWEVMSLGSFFLVMYDLDKTETRKSGLFYFIMTQMSTVFLMFAFLTVYSITGSFDIKSISGISAPMNTVVFLAVFIGFSIKAGVMPFHKWLPYAHSASPSNISALMSGVMLKVAIYGIVRYLLFVLDPASWWGVLILIFGTFSAVMGVIYALKEHDIKKLLAYHSIENIGIILIGIGLYVIFHSYGFNDLATLSLLGALFHTLNHALFKSLLFLTAGSVVEATGTRNIEKMGGLMKTMPYTGFLFLIGSAAISALPPLNGFVSELMLFSAYLQSFILTGPFMKILMFAGLSIFALTSALAAACFVKAFGIIFLAAPRSDEARKSVEVSPYMISGSIILAVCCALLGIFSYQIFSALGFRLPLPDMAIIGLLLLLFLIFTWVMLRLTSNRKTRVSETWGCGLTSQNSRMEYTASGFSEPILTIFRPIYRTVKKSEMQYQDSKRIILIDGHVEMHTFKIFEEKIYMPTARFVHRISTFVSNLQDVDLDVYIVYSFIAIVVLIVLMGWVI